MGKSTRAAFTRCQMVSFTLGKLMEKLLRGYFILVTCLKLQRLELKMPGKKAKSGGKICPEGKAWARRTFDTYPSAYANLAASKYCKDPNYAKKSKGGKRKGR